MLTALAGLIVPVALRAWLRDLIAALTPSAAGLVKDTPFTITGVGQTAVTIPFTGGFANGVGERFITNLPTGQISRIDDGLTQFGVQVTIELPTTSDVEVTLFKDGLATVYRTEIQTDNKALISTFVMTGITLATAPATYSLRVRRVAGTSDLVVQYAAFYMLVP
jgi:hypothetical protein